MRTDYENKDRRCSYCGSQSPVIWVHGHGQCAACGINVAECCQGSQCKTAQSSTKKKINEAEFE